MQVPNGYVIRSPSDTIDVVALFDGRGESSTHPFSRLHLTMNVDVLVEPFVLGNQNHPNDQEVHRHNWTKTIGDFNPNTRRLGVYEKTLTPTVFIDHYFHINMSIGNTNVVKKKYRSCAKGFSS